MNSNFDPMAEIAELVRSQWQLIMYAAGYLVAVWIARREAAMSHSTWGSHDVHQLLFVLTAGLFAGNWAGWWLELALQYGLGTLLVDSVRILRFWQVGTSFYGASVGLLSAAVIFTRQSNRRAADVFDFTAPLVCIGLLTGCIARLADNLGNFINGAVFEQTDGWLELFSGERVHASEVYEPLLESIFLFALLLLLVSKRRPQLVATGLFLLLHSIFRLAREVVLTRFSLSDLRWISLTGSQLFSALMPLISTGLLVWAYRRGKPSGNFSASLATSASVPRGGRWATESSRRYDLQAAGALSCLVVTGLYVAHTFEEPFPQSGFRDLSAINETIFFDIPRSDLSQAISTLAKQANASVAMVAECENAGLVKVGPLAGTLTLEEAANTLFGSAGVTFRIHTFEDGGFILDVAPPQTHCS